MNKTKMIVTVGPKSNSEDIIRKMIISGADVIRINMSYASFEEAKDIILKVRKINLDLNIQTGIMIDTLGPEIRIGNLEKPFIKLEKGKLIRIVYNNIVGNEEMISVNSKEVIERCEENDEIFLNSGEVKIIVDKKTDDTLICKIDNDGKIKPNTTVNLKNITLNTTFLSEYDKKCIEFASKFEADFLALSHVRDNLDVLDVNDLLINLNNSNMQIISKIENKSAIDEIENILKVSDGIMVSRGDLGLEFELEKLPCVQKRIATLTKNKGKICIIATEMLASMEKNIRPTRAEVSDVANSVLDKTDAVMLSAETAIGDYPVETVLTMNKIIDEIENEIDYNDILKKIDRKEEIDISKAISYSAVDSANRVSAKAIVCSTLSGLTAKDISNYIPSCPVIATSPIDKVVRGLTINYGIIPFLVSNCDTTEELIKSSIITAKKVLKLEKGDKIVIAGSFPMTINYTNFIKIEEIK